MDRSGPWKEGQEDTETSYERRTRINDKETGNLKERATGDHKDAVGKEHENN